MVCVKRAPDGVIEVNNEMEHGTLHASVLLVKAESLESPGFFLYRLVHKSSDSEEVSLLFMFLLFPSFFFWPPSERIYVDLLSGVSTAR